MPHTPSPVILVTTFDSVLSKAFCTSEIVCAEEYTAIAVHLFS